MKVILRYAGSDATAAYDEIHSPGIIAETLPLECYKGLIDQAEVVNLLPQQLTRNLNFSNSFQYKTLLM